MTSRPTARALELDFRTLFESAPGHYLVLAPDFTIVAVTDAYLRATMTQRDEILGRNLFEVFPDNPEDASATGVDNLRASLERVLARRVPDAMAVQKYDIRRPHHEGGAFEERFWSPVNTPVLAPTGEVRYIIHRVEDVTDYVRLERDSSERERRDQELRTRAGRMEAEIVRRAQEIQEANRELRRLQAELEHRVEARTADLARTNEALQRSEEQLRQSQKLEAVGRLAGGVAHDFNNLLTAIMGHGAFLRLRFRSGDPALEEVDEILAAAERAAALTRQLLAFSRQQVLEPRVLDLDAIVHGLDRMLRRLIGEDIDLVTASAPDLGSVRADPGQLEQVLVNLALNARDAMPEGGKLTVETANLDLADGVANGFDIPPGRYVMLAVSDTGCGIPREHLPRIFEPFFTTKDRARGTGLGLATVHGIIKQSGGHIEVYSEPGHGTTFKVYLPRVDDVTEAPLSPRAAAHRYRGDETVLVVEDEAMIRRILREALQSYGYVVLEASDGVQAIRIVEERGRTIDLMVTDVVMPIMSGPELARRVSEIRPGLPTLFVSGYTDRALIHQGFREAGTAFLQKPFRPDELVRKVRELLDTSVSNG